MHRVDETVGDDDVDHDEADSHDVDGGALVERSGGGLGEAHDEAEGECDEHRQEHVVDNEHDQAVLFEHQHRCRHVVSGGGEVHRDPEVVPRHQWCLVRALLVLGSGSRRRWCPRRHVAIGETGACLLAWSCH